VDFDFSTDQEMLRETVRRLLTDRAPISPYVREQYRAEVVGADEVWRGLGDLGVLGVLAPETHGGTGTGMVDAAVVLEELGRAVCPTPFASSAIAAVGLVVDAGTPREHDSLLRGLADGSTIGTVACYEPGRRYDWSSPETVAHRDHGTWQLRGAKVHVPDGAAADLLLVTATDESCGWRVPPPCASGRTTPRQPSRARSTALPSRTSSTAWALRHARSSSRSSTRRRAYSSTSR
jgi:alkylation response protein AidB-like acyl-CoA dehydrogenase